MGGSKMVYMQRITIWTTLSNTPLVQGVPRLCSPHSKEKKILFLKDTPNQRTKRKRVYMKVIYEGLPPLLHWTRRGNARPWWLCSPRKANLRSTWHCTRGRDPVLPCTEAVEQREALVQGLHTPIQVCRRCLETTVLQESKAARLMNAAQKAKRREVFKNEATFLKRHILTLACQRIHICTGREMQMVVWWRQRKKQ